MSWLDARLAGCMGRVYWSAMLGMNANHPSLKSPPMVVIFSKSQTMISFLDPFFA